MNAASVPSVLTIAGSDSGGGAGIQAGLKTFAALGVYGTSAITAITAQNTQGVRDVFTLPAGIVAAQIDAVAEDIPPSAVKTGMLATAELIEIVAAKAGERELRPLVVDPVMVATSGHTLLEPDAVEALKTRLLPLASIVTPNLAEAETLVGRELPAWEDAREAAQELVAMGAGAAVITDVRSSGPAIDLLYDGNEFHEFTASRVDTTNTHGSGCTFASAIAAALAKGSDLRGAIAMAKAYVTKAMQAAYPIGRGRGPVHHFYRYWQASAVSRADKM